MADIGKLNVRLTASAGAFLSTMNKGAKQVNSFSAGVAASATRVTALGTKLTALAAPLAALAGVGGFGLLVKSSLDNIDATSKLADRLGVSTERLVAYRHAAGLAGASASQFDKALEQLNRRMGMIAAGAGGESLRGLESLGLTMQDMQGLAADEQFRKIADAMQGIEDPARKAAAASALFGEEAGSKLLNLLSQGAEGLDAAEEEARRLGITFSRLDGAKVEMANDAMSRMRAMVTGVGQTLAIKLAPFIEAAATKLVDLGVSGEGIASKIGTGFEFILKAVAKVADAWSFLDATAKIASAGVASGIGFIIDGLSYFLDTINEAIKGLNTLASFAGLDIEIGQIGTATIDDIAQQFHRAGEDLFIQAGESYDAFLEGHASQKAQKFIDDLRANAERSAQAIADAANRGPLSDAADSLDEDAQKIVKTLEDLEKRAARMGLSDLDVQILDLQAAGATAEQIDRLRAAFDKIGRAEGLAEATKQLDEIQSRIDAFGKSDIELKISAFGDIEGVSEEMRRRYETLLRQAGDMDAVQDLLSKQSPIEQAEAQVDALERLLRAGKIDTEQFATAMENLKGDFEEEGPDTSASDRAPSLMEANAQNIARAMETVRRLNDDTGKSVDEKQLKEEQKTNALLARIETTLKNQPQPQVVTI